MILFGSVVVSLDTVELSVAVVVPTTTGDNVGRGDGAADGELEGDGVGTSVFASLS